MARPKGLPKTGGRKKGSTNKAPKERAIAAAKMGLLPHEFLLAVSRGERIAAAGDKGLFYIPEFKDRFAAAVAAAPYYAPKLGSIEHTGAGGGPIDHSIVVTFIKAKA